MREFQMYFPGQTVIETHGPQDNREQFESVVEFVDHEGVVTTDSGMQFDSMGLGFPRPQSLLSWRSIRRPCPEDKQRKIKRRRRKAKKKKKEP